MAKESQFSETPPLRFELTEEQAAAVDAAKLPGGAALIVGYAQRHPWPDPNRFTLCAWFLTMEDAEAALVAGGIMASRKRRTIPKARTPKTP